MTRPAVERKASSRNRSFRGRVGARINSDVFVQNFRADGDRFQGGNLKRPMVVNVDHAAHNIDYREILAFVV
jgi:hypothetical protein